MHQDHDTPFINYNRVNQILSRSSAQIAHSTPVAESTLLVLQATRLLNPRVAPVSE
jgi:hypothetical protein